jgi:hypothetical protein
MASAFWQRLFGAGPYTGLGGTGGIAGGGMPPAWSTPPFNPNAGPLPSMGGAGVSAVSQPMVPMYGKNTPKWLQKASGGFNNVMGRLSGPDDPNLNAQENDARKQQAQMAMIGQLLQGAAPRPKGTGSPLADFGSAMMAGQQAGNQFSADALRAQLMKAQIAQAQQQQGPQDPSDIRAMQALGYPLTPEGFKQYNADQAKPGTTINIGEKLAEPIPIAQLDTVRLPDGTTPPIGTTYQQARDMGAKVLSAEDQKRTVQADQALGILNQLEELAIGPEGVFNEVQPGLANRAAAALDFGLEMLTQNDPRASQFHDMSQATLAPFIKFLGETGSLAQGDVQRAIGLLPRTFPLPDTGEVAREKIAELREIITRGVTKMNSVSRQSKDVPPPPPGFIVDPE